MHIAGKYGRLFELKERVDAGVFTNQAYAANRNRSKLLQGVVYALRAAKRAVFFM